MPAGILFAAAKLIPPTVCTVPYPHNTYFLFDLSYVSEFVPLASSLLFLEVVTKQHVFYLCYSVSIVYSVMVSCCSEGECAAGDGEEDCGPATHLPR